MNEQLDIKNLPEELRTLFLMEAHVYYARNRLNTSLAALKEKENLLRTTRPPFFYVQKRRESAEEEKDVGQAASVLENGLAEVEGLAKRLADVISIRLEHEVRTRSFEYRLGLASRSLRGDWKGGLLLAERKIDELVKRLGIARAELSTAKNKTVSEAAGEFMNHAFEAAMEVEKEFRFINHIAHDYDSLVKGKPGQQLPEISLNNLAERIRELMGETVQLAQPRFSGLVQEAKDLKEKVLPSIHLILDQTETNSETEEKSFVQTLWEGYRKHALERWVDASQNIEALEFIESELKKIESRPIVTPDQSTVPLPTGGMPKRESGDDPWHYAT